MEQNYETLVAKNVTVSDYLTSTRKIVIPRYQRPYSWEKKECRNAFRRCKRKLLYWKYY